MIYDGLRIFQRAEIAYRETVNLCKCLKSRKDLLLPYYCFLQTRMSINIFPHMFFFGGGGGQLTNLVTGQGNKLHHCPFSQRTSLNFDMDKKLFLNLKDQTPKSCTCRTSNNNNNMQFLYSVMKQEISF